MVNHIGHANTLTQVSQTSRRRGRLPPCIAANKQQSALLTHDELLTLCKARVVQVVWSAYEFHELQRLRVSGEASWHAPVAPAQRSLHAYSYPSGMDATGCLDRDNRWHKGGLRVDPTSQPCDQLRHLLRSKSTCLLSVRTWKSARAMSWTHDQDRMPACDGAVGAKLRGTASPCAASWDCTNWKSSCDGPCLDGRPPLTPAAEQLHFLSSSDSAGHDHSQLPLSMLLRCAHRFQICQRISTCSHKA